MTLEHEEAASMYVLVKKYASATTGNELGVSVTFKDEALAALIAEVRRQTELLDADDYLKTPDDIKGRFQSELFWRGAYAMLEAIRARLEEGR